jgi:hypothetical protein
MKDIDDDAIFLLKKEVENKMGFSLKAPTNFNALITRVMNETGEMLSISTIKRLWGYVNQPSSPRLSTLSILSRFLRFRDFDDFCLKKRIYTSVDSEFISLTSGEVKDLRIGDELMLEWKPDRFCRIRYEEEDQFKVVNAINCKLQKNDRFHASFVAVGHPLYATELMRGDECLNDYVAGKNSGLLAISIKHAEEKNKE